MCFMVYQCTLSLSTEAWTTSWVWPTNNSFLPTALPWTISIHWWNSSPLLSICFLIQLILGLPTCLPCGVMSIIFFGILLPSSLAICPVHHHFFYLITSVISSCLVISLEFIIVPAWWYTRTRNYGLHSTYSSMQCKGGGWWWWLLYWIFYI